MQHALLSLVEQVVQVIIVGGYNGRASDRLHGAPQLLKLIAFDLVDLQRKFGDLASLGVAAEVVDALETDLAGDCLAVRGLLRSICYLESTCCWRTVLYYWMHKL